VTVDDVEPVYRAAERWAAFDDEAFRTTWSSCRAASSSSLVEIDHRGVDRLPVTRAPRSRASGFNPWDDEQMSARLFRAGDRLGPRSEHRLRLIHGRAAVGP